MTFAEYESLAMRTANQELTTDESLSCAAMGLSGEAGEFTDAIKKIVYHNHALSRSELIKELGDVLWYVALACNALGVPLEAVPIENVHKLAARYPDGFNAHASINRAE